MTGPVTKWMVGKPRKGFKLIRIVVIDTIILQFSTMQWRENEVWRDYDIGGIT